MKTSKRQNVGELEELVLLMVGVLGSNAYGNAVVEEINTQANRSLTLSAVHAVLLRLEKRIAGKPGWRSNKRKRRKKKAILFSNKQWHEST